MCGIAGIVGPSAIGEGAERTLDAMTEGIRTRGPDGAGRLLRPMVGLVHTRLAIIDLETGDQPIWNETGTVACVFNGEIYNFRHLVADLSARGHVFSTRTDTEVLVHLYEEYGDDLVRHIRGMYAFAICDFERRRLLMGRDRLGIKPLYFAQLVGQVAFASSIESVLAAGGSRDIDPAAIAQYMRFHKIPEPRTAYRAVRTLLPGHVGVVDLSVGRLEIKRFYDTAARPTPKEQSPEDAIHAARVAFERAVGTHLVADVEVAAFLSGGIDSSLVVAQAQRMAAKPLRTFTVRFEGPRAYDESPFAEEVARRLGTRHETLSVTAAPADLVRTAIRAAQQPFAPASFLPLLLLCEQTAKHVKVVLTGDGGDEVGFGYPWYRWMRAAAKLPRWLRARSIHEAIRVVEQRVPGGRLNPLRRALKFGRGLFLSGAAASDAWRYDVTERDAFALLRPEHRPGNEALPSPSEIAWDDRIGDVEALRAADLQVLLRDEMLPKLDRAGMAFGLEGRVPLLDDDFVSAMLDVPAQEHLRDPNGKALLRTWARELVPGVDAERPKHGFDVPILDWLQTSLRDDVDRLLLRPARRGLVDPVAARSVFVRALAGTPGAAHATYALLMLELWFEESAS